MFVLGEDVRFSSIETEAERILRCNERNERLSEELNEFRTEMQNDNIAKNFDRVVTTAEKRKQEREVSEMSARA